MTVDSDGSPTDLDRFAAYRDTVDEAERRALRNDLVRDHLALSVHLARWFTNKGISDDDLLQVAAVGCAAVAVVVLTRKSKGSNTDEHR